MASVKIASLFLKTLSKPIANRLKRSAKEHERFREYTISFAQFLHRSELNMRVKLLGETHHPKHVRPLNDAKAIDSGANFLAESFLFAFAAAIILGENYRSSRKESKRRDLVAETLASQAAELAALREAIEEERDERERSVRRERDLEKIVEEIVSIGIRGGFLHIGEGNTTDSSSSAGPWRHHTTVAEEARRFGTSGRAVHGEESGDEDERGSVPSMHSRVLEELERAGVTTLDDGENVSPKSAL